MDKKTDAPLRRDDYKIYEVQGLVAFVGIICICYVAVWLRQPLTLTALVIVLLIVVAIGAEERKERIQLQEGTERPQDAYDDGYNQFLDQ